MKENTFWWSISIGLSLIIFYLFHLIGLLEHLLWLYVISTLILALMNYYSKGDIKGTLWDWTKFIFTIPLINTLIIVIVVLGMLT